MDREPQSLWSVVVLRAGRLLTLAALDGLSTADGRAVLVLAHRAQSPRGVDGVDAKDTQLFTCGVCGRAPCALSTKTLQ